MKPTVQTLLDRRDLRSRCSTPAGALRAGALDAAVRGRTAPTSPTPRRSSTRATCCSRPAPSSARRLRGRRPRRVRRLRAPPATRRASRRSASAPRSCATGTPDALVAACTAQRAAAVRGAVPGAVHRGRARRSPTCIAADAYARQAWALAAQRAISLAALRPDGLGGDPHRALASARRLGRPRRRDGIARPRGARRRTRPARARRGRRRGAVDAAARPAREPHGRRRRVRRDAAAHHPADPRRRRRACAACSRSATPPSSTRPAARSSPRSSPSRASRSSRTATSTGRAATCARGCCAASSPATPTLAERVAAEMWGPLPAAPVRVAVADAPTAHVDRLTELLELRVEERGGRLFFGRDDEHVVLVVEEADDGPRRRARGASSSARRRVRSRCPPTASRSPTSRRCARSNAPARPGRASSCSTRSAGRACSRSSPAPTPARSRSRRSPRSPSTMRRTARRSSTTTRAWLEHGGQFDATAQALGVHRHTVRSRIALAERLLGRDLSGFHARADLWAALLAVG